MNLRLLRLKLPNFFHRSGLKPSQAKLKKASPVLTRKVSTGTFELEADRQKEGMKNVKVVEETIETVLPKVDLRGMKKPQTIKDVEAKSETKPKNETLPVQQVTTSSTPLKTIKIVIQAKTAPEPASSESSSSSTSRSSSSNSLAEEWKENCLEIEELPESPTVMEISASNPEKASEGDEPVIEFLQPSAVFITEADEGQVEEPYNSHDQYQEYQEYPIQNFRNKSRQSNSTSAVSNTPSPAKVRDV